MNKICYIVLVLLMTTACKSPEARVPKSVKSGSFIDASIIRNKKLQQYEHALIKDIMTQNPEIEYFPSENGFWYYYNTKVEKDTLTPKFGDLVTFDYNVKDLNGNLIYSKEELATQEYPMDQKELFKGLREGLKLMKVGETVTFLFPSQLAYGYYGDRNRIGTNVPLVCEVTINAIKPVKNH